MIKILYDVHLNQYIIFIILIDNFNNLISFFIHVIIYIIDLSIKLINFIYFILLFINHSMKNVYK